jgi:CRISPR-associated protein (TIGR03984 family)
MRRQIQARAATLERPQAGEISDPSEWLQQQAAAGGFCWLLAHADDGVIWGRLDDGRLLTSHDAALGDAEAAGVCPPLRASTLQQARVFGSAGELLLWRDGEGGWNARIIRDGGAGDLAQWKEAFDEPQLLWGTHGRQLLQGFTFLEHGAEGLRHAVPLALPLGETGATTPPRLVVRHYLDDVPFAQIAASRLVELTPG